MFQVKKFPTQKKAKKSDIYLLIDWTIYDFYPADFESIWGGRDDTDIYKEESERLVFFVYCGISWNVELKSDISK